MVKPPAPVESNPRLPSPALPFDWWADHTPWMMGAYANAYPVTLGQRIGDGRRRGRDMPNGAWPPPLTSVIWPGPLRDSCPRKEIRAWVDEEEQRRPVVAGQLTWLWQAGVQHRPKLAEGDRRVFMARSSSRNGLVSRYVEVHERLDGSFNGVLGWEWYRRAGDPDDYCEFDELLQCSSAHWTENWAWCDTDASRSVDWNAVGQALDKAGAWELDSHVPERWAGHVQFQGRPPVLAPPGAGERYIFWVTYIAQGDQEPFGISALGPDYDHEFAGRMHAVAAALPWDG